MSESPADARMLLHEPFEERPRQKQANLFGMWVFLASEVMFFGALMGFYVYIRVQHPLGLVAGASQTNATYGTINLFLLLTSSCTMAIAERALDEELRRIAKLGLWITLVLGIGFLITKGLEYHDDLDKHLMPGPEFPVAVTGAEELWAFYWTATAIHAIHLSIGLLLIVRLLLIARKRALVPHVLSVSVTTLYWHLVDCVWIILYALLYLPGAH